MNPGDKKITSDPVLRAEAEARLAIHQPPEDLARPAAELLHELRVHQIELEMQNEALRETQLALEESRDRFVDLYEFAPVGYLTLSAEGMVTEINLTAVTLLGRAREKLLNRSLRTLVIAADQDGWVRHFMGVINQAEKRSIELTLNRGDDTVFSAQLDCVGNAAGVRITMSDISERKAAEEKIQLLAFYDPLTGLPNRRLLLDRLQQSLATCARIDRELALLFIDLDNFKNLNDTLGHQIGDQLLIQVAQRLVSCVRVGDTVARLGGDEFVVILADLSAHPLEAATQTKTIGEKILTAFRQPYHLGARVQFSTASIGATLFSEPQASIEELMQQADIAMYQAKKAGRNTLCFFDPLMQTSISARMLLEDELHNALEKDQFQMYYQIQVDSNNQATGAEALIRWLHPERGIILPAQFIPLAEETGLILPIGRWVLETACTQIKAWEKNMLTRNLVLAVNVSAKQFRMKDLVDQVQAVMQQHAINPQQLKLELTEGMLFEDVEDTIATMNSIKALGIQFSLDDFGTGYSSLQYLKRLPLDQLKIDQSFVRDIVTDSNDKAIVRTIIAMAQSLDMNVIAEGVETNEQRLLLLNDGCLHYQGYYFGMPLPINQFDASVNEA